MNKSKFFEKENLEFSRNQIVVKHSTNPEITFKHVGTDYVVISQNSQNICIYRDQLQSLQFAIQEIGGMIADEESNETPKSVNIDLLVAGKLNEHQENPNMEFEPKTPTLEDLVEEPLVDGLKSEPQDEEKIETIIVSDTDTPINEEIIVKKPNSKPKKSSKKK